MLLLFENFLSKRSSEKAREDPREKDERQQVEIHLGWDSQTEAGQEEEGCGIIVKIRKFPSFNIIELNPKACMLNMKYLSNNILKSI